MQDSIAINESVEDDVEITDEIDLQTNSDFRQEWQKPDLVIQMMGDISNKTVADIGAGSGYFAFRLLFNAQKVIAIDIDQDMIVLMNELKKMFPDSLQNKIQTRLAQPNDPNLLNDEVDVVLIVNTFPYIENKSTYLKLLQNVLKPGGQIYIVDYKVKRLPIEAPSYNNRMLLHEVEDILIETGFHGVTTNDTSLEFQYVVNATNPE